MKKTFLFLLFSLCLFSATARVLSVSTTLSGANEVPANASTATGTVIGTFDDVSLLLNLTVTFNGLSTNATAAHIHKAVIGVNGPVILPFGSLPASSSGTFNFSGILTAPQAADLFAGLYYVNIHSSSFPGGEIRGQLSASALQVFTINNIQDFNAIGGYSYFEGTFPSGNIASPYTRSGPTPQNDFIFEATSVQLFGFQDKLTTYNGSQPITLNFKGNNVRKIRSLVRSEDINGLVQAGNVTVTATTNLGNTAIVIANSSSQVAGFRVMNENEYITQIVFSGPSDGQFTTIDDIMFGDDSPQNVALNFDGVDDYVEIPSTVGNFETNDNFTVSCWIRPDPTATHNQEIIDKWDNSNSSFFAFTIRYNGSSGLVSAGQYSEPNFPGLASNTDLRDGRWHHVAFTKNGSILTLYVDGEGQGNVTDNATGTTINTLPLNIGRRGDGNNYFKGEIDEVRIWGIGKTATEIANERFCKTPNGLGLFNSYNFSNGVPHDNNALITQVQDAVSTNHGTLNNFAKTGDASNFVTGQVKYVNNASTMGTNNGSSWANAFIDLKSALTNYSCNDLFEVYVAKGNTSYKPAAPNGVVNTPFTIPSGMRLYGGFAGTEKSINQRNITLIHSTNKTSLSGDLNGNDIPFVFTTNRSDNSDNPVRITGNNVVFDGFTVRGAKTSIGGLHVLGSNTIINNCRIVDNSDRGIQASIVNNVTISNSSILGNGSIGLNIFRASININNCIITNNGFNGINVFNDFGNNQLSISNCTTASNSPNGIDIFNNATLTTTIKNTISYGNATTGLNISGSGTINNTITNSLIQGQTSTANGNLNGNTVNPQFVSPLANSVRSDLGDYRLKDFSPCINTGTDVGVSPLDLDRNTRPKGGKTDIGAYESNVNMNEIISITTGNWESNSTWNLNRVPLATDKVILNTPFSVTVTTNTAKAKIVEQKPSSDLKFNAGGSLELKQ